MYIHILFTDEITLYYIRNGTCSIFAFVEPLAGVHHVSVREHRTAQFSSGEVAYLLSQGENGSVWGQAIGTENYPVLGGATVYQINIYAGCEGNPGDPSTGYSNKDAAVYVAHSYDTNGFCTICDIGYEPAEQVSDTHHSELNSTHIGYYAIENAGQLYWFAQQVNGGKTGINAVLTKDIVVNEGVLTAKGELNPELTNPREWTPAGSFDNKYIGTFDGQNHTISGLYFNDIKENDIGLFGYVGNGGKIFNVGVVDSYFNGSDGVGGVCGSNEGTITNCYNSGTVSGDTRVGGVFGWSNGTITNCYNTGNISGSDYVGGVCGNNVRGIISNCYNSGAVSGTTSIGGVCGENYTEDISSIITNCYNIGTVSGSDVYVGGVCGRNYSTITNCYYLAETADENGGKTTAQFNSGEVAYLLSQGENGSVWGQTIDTENYPVLGGAKVYYEAESSFYSNYEPAVYNETDERYEISNASQLYWFAEYINSGNKSANAVLTADITVNKNVLNESGELNSGDFISWTPIGYFNSTKDNAKYTGTFDGQGFTVSGLYFDDTSASYVGLFGSIGRGGKIQNVGVVDSYFNGNDYVGGVCGANYDTITNCYNTGIVKGANNIGGICGYNFEGTITNCYNTGAVSETNRFGSICGYNVSGTITNCYYDSTVYDGNAVGVNDVGTVSENVLGKTAAQFSSGEVAYLLSQGENGSVWGQDLSVSDSCPKLGGMTVYRNRIVCYSYSNDKDDITETEHTFNADGICTDCGITKGTLVCEGATEYKYGDKTELPLSSNNDDKDSVISTVWYEDEALETILEEIPTAPGTYYVKASVPQTENYSAAELVVKVIIEKADPEYTVPTGLTAAYGDTLTDVKLPTGFAWQDKETTSVGTAGKNTFKVTFILSSIAKYTNM